MIGLLVLTAAMTASAHFGFGVGQQLDRYLLTPSLFTMRVALGEKNVLCPSLKLEYSYSDDTADDTQDSELELGFGLEVHRAIWKSDNNGLYAIVGPQIVLADVSLSAGWS